MMTGTPDPEPIAQKPRGMGSVVGEFGDRVTLGRAAAEHFGPGLAAG